MAFTKEEHENLLREIAESGGDTPNMLELMQKLRDDFDERESELRRYHEESDKEEPEGVEKEEKEIEGESKEDDKEDGGERRRAYGALKDYVSRSDYENLRNKYIARFFSTPEESKKDQKENVKEDGKKKSFDELFKDREG